MLVQPGGAFLFEESGGGDAAELEVDLVDPLFFACKPLQAVAYGAVFGQFVEIEAGGGVDSHAVCQCSSAEEFGIAEGGITLVGLGRCS